MGGRGIAIGPLAVALFLWTGAAGACSVSVGWEPYGYYSYRDKAGGVAGFDIDVVSALGRAVGCELVFRETPFARLMAELEQGVIQATSSLKRTPEREAFGWYSRAYRQSRIALYVRQGEAAAMPLSDLGQVADTRLRLGGVAGYYLGARFAELMKQPAFAARVEMAVDQDLNVQKLVNHRIDGLITDDETVIEHILSEAGLRSRVERHPLPLEETDLHIVFSRKSVDETTFRALDRALEQMMADGRLAAIAARYAGHP